METRLPDVFEQEELLKSIFLEEEVLSQFRLIVGQNVFKHQFVEFFDLVQFEFPSSADSH